MSPNLITLVRVIMAFGSIALFRFNASLSSDGSPYGSLIGLLVLVVTLVLDAVDGYVARRIGRATEIGAAFDIAADRIVESVFWIYFASAGLISFWIPIIIVTRGGITDFMRTIAFTQGQTAFGEKTMMRTWWGRLLVGSRTSRVAYGVTKCAAFFALGLQIVFANAPGWQSALAAGMINGLSVGAIALAVSTVVFCLVRGVPVIVEGMRFFRETLVIPKLW